MAIDPNIPLQGRATVAPDFGGSMLKGMNMAQIQQEIAASKATQANVEAALPGIQGTSQSAVAKGTMDTRDASITQQMGANSHLWNKTDASGKPYTDYAARNDFMNGIGAGDKIAALNQEALKTENAQITNSTNQQELNKNVLAAQEQLKQTVYGEDLADEASGKLTHGQIAINHARRLKAAYDVNSLLKNEANIPEVYNKAAAQSARTGVISEQQQIANRQNQEQIDISGQNARTYLNSMLQTGVPLSAASGKMEVDAQASYNEAGQLTTAGQNGKTIIAGGKLINAAEVLLAKTMGTPEQMSYIRAAEAVGLNPSDASTPGKLTQLGTNKHIIGDAQHKASLQGMPGAAQGGQVAPVSATGAVPAQGAQFRAAVPAPTGMVKMRKPDGTTGNVPAGHVKEALKDGLTLVK